MIENKVGLIFFNILEQYHSSIKNAYLETINNLDYAGYFSKPMYIELKYRKNKLESVLRNLNLERDSLFLTAELTVKDLNALLIKYQIPLIQFNEIMYKVIYTSIKKAVPDYIWQDKFVYLDEYSPNLSYNIYYYQSNISFECGKMILSRISIDITKMVEYFDSMTNNDLYEKLELTEIIHSYMTPVFIKNSTDSGYQNSSYLINHVNGLMRSQDIIQSINSKKYYKKTI